MGTIIVTGLLVFFVPKFAPIFERISERGGVLGAMLVLSVLGIAALVAARALRGSDPPLSQNDYLALMAFSFVACLAAGGFLFLGRKWMAAAAFPVAFLIFLVPLPDGAVAHAIVTFEVKPRPILPPESTSELKIPARVTGSLRRFINGSPYIEVRHNQVRSLAREVLGGMPEDATDWQRIEALYDRVLETARYVEGPDKSAVDTLRDGFGDCQGRSALFIALCRSSKIPARMVWVDGHCFPEFYLLHSDKQGSWYPCESAGSRAFGEMPLARIVLQKGDKFRVPERPKEWLRYASDYLIGVPTPGARTPKVQYIREQF